MKTSLRLYSFFFLMVLLASMSITFFVSFRFFAHTYINACIALCGDETLLAQAESLLLPITLLTTLLPAFIFTPLLWIGSGRLVKPLRQLRHDSARLSDGDFTIPRIDSPIREIADLSAAFSTMALGLEESMEAQKTFLQNAAHELRTPLMSIGGYAQAIQDRVMPDPSFAADIIIRETQRMKQLIDGILALARLDAREQETAPAWVEIRAYLAQSLERIQGMALSLKRELVFHCGLKELYAWLDPLLLDQACFNLLANALQHARRYVYVGLSEQGSHILITVENDGAPLTADELPKLFQRFYKGSSGNFGIGLAIVKSAAGYMNGTVSAKNGKYGACFMLLLPKSDLSKPEPPKPGPPKPEPPKPGPPKSEPPPPQQNGIAP